MSARASRPPRPARTRRASGEGQTILQGLGVAPGIAIGPAYVHGAEIPDLAECAIAPDLVEGERQRFRTAVEASKKQLTKLKQKTGALPAAAAEELGYLLDAHVQMLSQSRLVRGVEKRIGENLVAAEAAVRAEADAIAEAFEAMEDSYLAQRVQDVREVGARLVRNLTQTPWGAFKNLPEGAIIVAEEITPADTAVMDPDVVGGFATVTGGAEGHTAIMARALGLPAVLGVADLVGAVRSGDTLIVDGNEGRIVVRPTAAMLERYERKRLEYEKEERQLARLTKLPSVSRDGVEFALGANVELPREVAHALAAGASSIGLLRSEFLFMNRNDVPGEEEQYAQLAEIVKGMAGRVVTVRTLDVGGEKLASALGDLSPGPNPALGLRAIRLSLARPELLETQLAAILRAGAHGPLRILVPMVATVDEMKEVREAVSRVARKLVRKGIAIADPLPPLGAMIEIPAAALAADALARVCDFFALGTNDLTMYALAIDRGDEQVAHLYNPLHPAVLRLIQFTAEAALRNRIPVSICGEIAGDPRYTALLAGLGIRELSMSPIKIPRVKSRVRGLDMQNATARARTVMEQWDTKAIATLVDEYNDSLVQAKE
ncbi:MAG: phosphoenolpyruvate--protein phosphotransferase [Alphaproteobacteria bacterium]|nr:phosphoenolpyruvate--protein phosphotransferase [Alphaproteobacteria bacterium]